MIRNFFTSQRNFFPVVIAAAALFAMVACTDDDAEPPTVKIVTPANGSSVKGPNVFVSITKTHFKYAGAAKVSAAQHDETTAGHIHIFLDKPAGLDANSIEHFDKYDTITLPGIAVGKHYLLVQGAEEGHDDIESMFDSVSFSVTAP